MLLVSFVQIRVSWGRPASYPVVCSILIRLSVCPVRYPPVLHFYPPSAGRVLHCFTLPRPTLHYPAYPVLPAILPCLPCHLFSTVAENRRDSPSKTESPKIREICYSSSVTQLLSSIDERRASVDENSLNSEASVCLCITCHNQRTCDF